jgi:hypothetical protein
LQIERESEREQGGKVKQLQGHEAAGGLLHMNNPDDTPLAGDRAMS